MKNVLKLLCLLMVLQLGVGSARAADPVLTVLGYVREIKLQYESVDENNNKVILSEMVNINRYYKEVKMIVINNHPTTTSNALVPTGDTPQIKQVLDLCDGTDKAMVVSPDYMGYGISDGKIHPYMCTELTARNIVDGVLAAIKYVKTLKNEKFGLIWSTGNYDFSNYYTLNVGYSQGGAMTLAVHKYLENEATQEVRNQINLKKSICGAGPYSQSYMFDVMENNGDKELGKTYENAYPLYIPFIIDGLKATFGNSILRDLSENEIYTEKFLNSGLLAIMRAKKTKSADLNSLFAEKLGSPVGFYDIINENYKDHSSKLYRGLRKALSQCDLLKGWKTKAELEKEGRKPTPIILYHWNGSGSSERPNGDEVVPFHESEMAFEYFKSLGYEVGTKSDTKEVTFWIPADSDITGSWQIADSDFAKYFGDLDTSDSHMGYGTRFYLSIFCGKLR